MKLDDSIQAELESATHQRMAQSSTERWLELCEQEKWECSSENLSIFIKVFGASWYFTRYIFFRGHEAIQIVEQLSQSEFKLNDIVDNFYRAIGLSDKEHQLEQARLIKNEIMLQILICRLEGQINQEQTEHALTKLAEATLISVMTILGLQSERSPFPIAVLGMGRMAGDEMNFGSDLDLIFLYEKISEESSAPFAKLIRLLLRHLSSVTSTGLLYEVDMRLRPHGTSGALITSIDGFLDYHSSEREVWERQMMTRCRIVMDGEQLARNTIQTLSSYTFANYEQEFLRNEIVTMRSRVEQEKGSPKGKFDVKRGKGGIMDIDFLTHYFQLSYGYKYPKLQTGSTRKALRILEKLKIINTDTKEFLLNAYNFLKTVEANLRMFDMKSISTFPEDINQHEAIARSMGYEISDIEKSKDFLEKYVSVTDTVRSHFIDLVGNPIEV